MPSNRSQVASREAILAIAAAVVVIIIGTVGYQWFRDAAACCGTRPFKSVNEPVPFDPEIRTGTLSNGLRYFVRANEWPSQRGELRLVVNAGSVLETESQRGVAHAVEHMAFRGTRNFPRSRMVAYLQSVGMRNGYDVNARTGFEQTTYRITIPTDRPRALDTAIAILRDWAHEVTFDPDGARQEAGVIFEEWRSSWDASERLSNARDSLLLSGSRYARRFPIGDTAVLRRFDLAEMRRFYLDWYRPELMAVIAVGDFDARKVEAAIRREFRGIPASPVRAERPRLSAPPLTRAREAVLSDPEAPSTKVALWYRRARVAPRTILEYRTALTEELMRRILNDRLTSAANRTDAPLLHAGISVWPLTQTLEAHVVSGPVADGRVREAVALLARHVSGLQKFGASKSELQNAKDLVVQDRLDTDTRGLSSTSVADALVSHFLGVDTFIPATADYEVTKAILADVKEHDIATVARDLSLDSATIILTTRGGASVASGAVARTADGSSLYAAARAGAEQAIDRGQDAAAMPRLPVHKPKPGSIASERVLRDLSGFDWTLSNGMRVIVKPTRFADAMVSMRLTAPGGASLAAERDYPSAFLSDQVLEAVGVGPLNGEAVGTLIDRSSITLEPNVAWDRIQLEGSTTLSDLEAFFQLTHLYLTEPRSDTAGFRRYMSRARAYARNRLADPDEAFEDSVYLARNPTGRRYLSARPEFIDAVSLAKALAFWRERSSNGSNFTAVIVGDVTLERLRPLVSRYLASIPAGHKERSRDFDAPAPSGVVVRAFHLGAERRARTKIVLSGNLTLTPELETTLRTTRDVLEMAIETRLREIMGGTYSVYVELDLFPRPEQQYVLQVDFLADPERVDELAKAAISEIDRIATNGPSDDEMAKVKAAALNDHGRWKESNRYWLGELSWNAQIGWPLEAVSERRAEVESLSVAKLKAATHEYFDTRKYLRLTMLPAERAGASVRSLP